MSNVSPFIPTAREILVVVSYNAMGGRGFHYAFLAHPLRPETGLIINDLGQLRDVPVEEWTELQGLAAAAKDTVAHGGGGRWSRPQSVRLHSSPY
jgi:hypothetical protein